MTDRALKAMTEDLETPDFEDPAFTLPVPLEQAKVAIVTSASLHHPDDADFEPTDTSYRVLHADRRDYILGHWSPNFDATGYAADYNTVFPIDRLDELAEAGIVGSVSQVHLAYAGNQYDLATIRMDTGPAGAKFLREQGVDVVLLTPV